MVHKSRLTNVCFVMLALVLLQCSMGLAQTATSEERFIEATKLIEMFAVRDIRLDRARSNEERDKLEKEILGEKEKAVKLLDEVMAYPCSKEEFEEAAWLKFELLSDTAEESELTELRRFVCGIDKTKYPEISRYLWVQFLRFAGEDFGEDYIKNDIKDEITRCGRNVPPDIAVVVLLLLESGCIDEESKEYKKYRKWISESSNKETQEIFRLYGSKKSECGEYYRNLDKSELAQECSKIQKKMANELSAMSKFEKKGRKWDEIDEQSQKRILEKGQKIHRKYFPQIAKLLDGLLENTKNEGEFNIAAYFIYRLMEETDEYTYPNLRKFVLGIDKEKHPEAAISLWENFLDSRLRAARLYRDTEYYEECAKEIEQELFSHDGEIIRGDLALEILEDKIKRKSPSFDEDYKKYRFVFLNSKDMSDKAEFWEFEKCRRLRILQERGESPRPLDNSIFSDFVPY